MKQSVSNCCGTIAQLHALCNTYEKVGGDLNTDSFLAKYIKEYPNSQKDKYCDEDANNRAKFLHDSPELEALHGAYAN